MRFNAFVDVPSLYLASLKQWQDRDSFSRYAHYCNDPEFARLIALQASNIDDNNDNDNKGRDLQGLV
jgi:hypothetical protein